MGANSAGGGASGRGQEGTASAQGKTQSLSHRTIAPVLMGDGSRALTSMAAEVFSTASRSDGSRIRTMHTAPLIAEIASLVGDPARAMMLTALLDGRALTATELAYAARVTPQTASTHLAKLAEAGLLTPLRCGRHRYFRLASAKVVEMLHGIVALALENRPRRKGAQRRANLLCPPCGSSGCRPNRLFHYPRIHRSER